MCYFSCQGKQSPFLVVLTWFLILGKIQDGGEEADHFWWRHRPPAAPPPIKYTSSCREDQRLSTESKIVSKYCNISKPLGGFHPPPPPWYHGGVWKVKLSEENFTFHLQYKHSGAFANRKCEELVYSKNPKMCDPILVTQVMQPYFSQSSYENATPFSGTFLLASYKKVPPPPGCDAPILKADRHTCATPRHKGVKKMSGWQDRSAGRGSKWVEARTGTY